MAVRVFVSPDGNAIRYTFPSEPDEELGESPIVEADAFIEGEREVPDIPHGWREMT